MKQANQNIIIDEATMEFSQSVLFTHLSDSLPSYHTARWGDPDNNWTTDSDRITEDQGTDTNDGDTQDYAENKEESTLKTLTEPEVTSNNFVCGDINNERTLTINRHTPSRNQTRLRR
jgi:hypothetical protein